MLKSLTVRSLIQNINIFILMSQTIQKADKKKSHLRSWILHILLVFAETNKAFKINAGFSDAARFIKKQHEHIVEGRDDELHTHLTTHT